MPTRTDDPPRPRPQIDISSPTPPTPVAPTAPAAEPPAAPAAPTSPAPPAPVARPAAPPRPARPADAGHPITQESFQAFLSAHQREGRWEAADEIEVRAIFGSVVLDFTRADLPPNGVVEIDAFSFGGSIEIIVPDGADVEIEGTPILGSIEQKLRKKGAGERIREWVTGEREADLPAPPAYAEPPYFHIDCRAIIGSVEVKVR